MRCVASVVSALTLLAAGAVVGQPAAAAPPVVGYSGQVESSVAGCPYIIWRLARHDNGDITGIFYYSDMTGVSQATGTMDQEGHFHLTLTSSNGQGPVGTVAGEKSANGAVVATMSGQGCANAQLHFNPIANLRSYNPSGANQ